MSWELTHKPNLITTGVPVIVPKQAVGAGGTVSVKPTHRLHWVTILNTGSVEIVYALSEAAFTAGVVFPIPALASKTLSLVGAVRTIVIGVQGGSPGEVTMDMSLSRQPISAEMPELTVAEDFPAFDNSDTDAIVPGVGTA